MVRRPSQMGSSAGLPAGYAELDASTDGSYASWNSISQQAPPASARGESSDLPPSYGDAVDNSQQDRGYPPEKSNGKAQVQSPPEDDDDSGSELGSTYTDEFEDDEEDWQLDEAANEISNNAGLPSYEESETMRANETVDDLVRDVMTMLPPQGATKEKQISALPKPLPCPVIIPQRRPQNKSQGFVRAYPPVLQSCGIDQDAFLKFLQNLHKTAQESPVFPSVQMAASVAAMAPPTIAMAVTIDVSRAAGMGPETPTGYRVNNYLDRMNEKLFQPLHLYAMIVGYKPDDELLRRANGRQGSLSTLIRSDHANFSRTTESMPLYNRPEDAKGQYDMSEHMQRVQLQEKSTRGLAQNPQTAPLVFPGVDYLLHTAAGVPGVVGNSILGVTNVVSQYLDRRLQLDVPPRERRRRRNHGPVNSPHAEVPSLVSWATSGAYNPRQSARDRRMERHLERDARRLDRGRGLKHERKRERKYGEGYFEELQARSDERRAGMPRQGSSGPTSPSEYQTGTRNPPQNRYGRERTFLAGGLVAGILGVAANTVAEAAGIASHRPTNQTQPGNKDRPGVPRAGSHEQGQEHADFASHDYQDRAITDSVNDDAGFVRRVVREDVIYLVIVNMPTEVEMSQAWEELEENGQR